jgi:hypothetical protein
MIKDRRCGLRKCLEPVRGRDERVADGECEVEEDVGGPRERRLRVTQCRRGFGLSTRCL